MTTEPPRASTVADLVKALHAIAPTGYAEAWDNVGLLCGDPSAAVTTVLLCVDYTEAVAEEGHAHSADAVIAYHPPLFSPVKRLTADTLSPPMWRAVREGVAVYSPHTAWDVVPGGTNDCLADVLGLPPDGRRPLRVIPDHACERFKLITFVPADALDVVAEALFDAGAGVIGDYSECSFRIPGVGTFRGGEASEPAVGEAGNREAVEEIRFESVVTADRLIGVVHALRTSHPYEEPAFDLIPLRQPPAKAEHAVGQGRVGHFSTPVDRGELIRRVKTTLGLSHVLVAGPVQGPARSAAVCAGSCGDLLDDVLRSGVDVYLTGEVRHHDALRAAAAGVTTICTLHSHSERASLRRLAERLAPTLPAVRFHPSHADHDPLSIR